jgi:hypothetical protein
MQRLYRIAAAAAVATFVYLPANLLAQSAPATGTDAAGTGTPATAAPPADTTKPASTADAPPKAQKKRRTARKETQQEEADRSAKNGTVPARYRNSVPKEYQQYVPFDDKRER